MLPRRRLAACILAALALAAWGCAELAGREPFSRNDLAAQANTVRESAKTRGEVREALGTPWLANERRRVDVFRKSGKQCKGLVIFMIPLPTFSEKYQGITLVSYDAAGSVDAAESGLSTSTLGQASLSSSFGLSAGDYLFVEGMFGRTLSVSPTRFLAERPASSDCVLLVGCGGNRRARAEFESLGAMATAGVGPGGACPNELAIDDGARQRLSLSNTWWHHRALETWPSASARERGSETCRKDGASCTVGHDYLVPVRVAPGTHQLRFSARSVDGEVTAELSCRPGEVVFANLVSEAHGRIEFSGELPTDLARHTVLLAEAGKWLLPEDAAITPAAAGPSSGNRKSAGESR